MTALLRCLPLCLLPRHLPKTLPQQERQQFYRSRKLVGEMKRLQSVHVSVIICGVLRSRLTPQTRERWKRRRCGCTASAAAANARLRRPTEAGNSSKREIGLRGYQGLSPPKGDASPLFIFLLRPSFHSSRVLCRTNVEL